MYVPRICVKQRGTGLTGASRTARCRAAGWDTQGREQGWAASASRLTLLVHTTDRSAWCSDRAIGACSILPSLYDGDKRYLNGRVVGISDAKQNSGSLVLHMLCLVVVLGYVGHA